MTRPPRTEEPALQRDPAGSTNPTSPFLQLKAVNKGFGSGPGRAEILHDLHLDIAEGEFVAIVGYSGAGKTTLISLIAGLIGPDSGTVTLQGRPVREPSPDRAVVFQNYSLLPWLTVRDNVGLAVDAVFPAWSPQRRREQVEKYIAMVNLTPAMNKRPHELSGGMRQRVSVARALAMDPKILLLDEPLSALDALTRATLQDEIGRIWERDRKTVVLITNDVDEGILLADRIIPLSAGPKATLGRPVPVNIERPRDRKGLNHDPAFQEIRREVLGYLLGEGGHRAGATVTRRLVLPDVEPEDLSIQPLWYYSRRAPRRSREIHEETVEVQE